MTDPDISLHGSRHGSLHGAARDPATEPDAAADLLRAGLLPESPAHRPDEEPDKEEPFRITAERHEPAWVDQTVEAARRAGVEGEDLRRVKHEAWRQVIGFSQALTRPRMLPTPSAG